MNFDIYRPFQSLSKLMRNFETLSVQCDVYMLNIVAKIDCIFWMPRNLVFEEVLRYFFYTFFCFEI
jgi:hypothetical protein